MISIEPSDWIGGVAVFDRALTAEELAKLTELNPQHDLTNTN